ncbi:MAG: ABC transporter substrate-binding protein [Bacteroidota bacterium]
MLVRTLLVGVLFTWSCVARSHVLPLPVSAPDTVVFHAQAERLFDEGMTRYRDGRYQPAAERFLRIIDNFGVSQRVTAALIMGAKSYYALGAITPARRLARTLLERYPESLFLDDARYTLALCSFQSGEYERAALEFLEVRETSTDTALVRRAERLLFAVAQRHLSVDQVQAVMVRAGQSAIRNSLTVALAERVWGMGDVQAALEILRPLVAQPRTVAGVEQAVQLLQRIERSGVVKVGVVLPLMRHTDQSLAGELGEELLDGIRFATDEHNAKAMPKVNIVVRDSEYDVGVAARQVSELGADNEIAAILGPAFSNEVQASAGIANSFGVPLITPTATADGLAAIGEYVFQANPDLSVRARAMAQFAYDRRNARHFAVLAPNDTTGKSMAYAFEREVLSLGGEVLDLQWYQPGETDLRVQLSAMRRKALERIDTYLVSFSTKMKNDEVRRFVEGGVPQATVDSLMNRSASVPVEFLFGAGGKRVADSLRIPLQLVRMKYDSLGIPVTNIDAIFLPIASSSEIGIVTSQLRYFNFQGLMLGTGNWQDLTELEQNRQYANGVIMTTDAHWDDQATDYQVFSREFQSGTGKRPTRNRLFGYDAMKLLLETVREGATRRDEIALALTKVRKFEGAHGRISLGISRVNSVLTVLQYRNRQLRRIAEIDVTRREITSFE